MLKKLLYIVIGVVVLFLVVALFLPASYKVERSIEIAKSPSVVFEQVADFNKWLAWNPWTEMEPTAKNTITGPQGAVGAMWAWEGKEVGVGSLTIHQIDKDKFLHSKLAFKAPMESEADDYITLEATPAGTKVIWRNEGNLPYPIGRYFGLSVEGMLGPQFDKGLANLKRVCESIPEPPPETPPAETKPLVKKTT